MKFHLYKVSGYEECIMSLRMSHGKYFSWEKAQHIQDLVFAVTNKQGFICEPSEYYFKLQLLGVNIDSKHPKLTVNYRNDVTEFKRLLGLTKDNAMGKFDHHTLMKYIDISFFTDGLHRGAQDDLDAHAMGFNNRITRFSTRLAEISEPQLSEWYEDKVISFHDVHKMMIDRPFYCEGVKISEFDPSYKFMADGTIMPEEVMVGDNKFKYSPFGYIHEKYADMSAKNGLFKDVQRGLIPLGQEGCALWKSDMFNMRYIYFRRSKLTKANPELKLGMEQLADQIEQNVPVFGEHFRMEFTDSGKWEHMNRVRTIAAEEWDEFKKYKENKHLQ